jgi:hypothetical protein
MSDSNSDISIPSALASFHLILETPLEELLSVPIAFPTEEQDSVSTPTISETTMTDNTTTELVLPMAGAYAIRNAGNDAPAPSLARYKSAARMLLEQRDQIKIELSITYPIIKPKLTFLDISASTLSDICVLGTAVNQIREHFQEYDLLQIFYILSPDLDHAGRPLATVHGSERDLFLLWSQLPISDVALHVRFLRTHVANDFIVSNLNLTKKFFQNNSSADLYNKCLESFNLYPEVEQGGPLLLHIMLNHLAVSNDRIAGNLLADLKTLSLSTYEGENVQTLVTNIRLILKHLAAFERSDPNHPSIVINRVIPNEFPFHLLKLFQTSSSVTFNECFHALEIAVLNNQAVYTSDQLLNLAEKHYTHLNSLGEWDGKSSKLNQTAFTAGASATKTVICWNCGKSGHNVTACTKPKNPTLIAANRTKFQANKRSSNGGRGRGRGGRGNSNSVRFAPPKTGEGNTRIINGTPMYYHFKTKVWKEDTRTPPTAPPSSVAIPPAAANTAASAPSPADSSVFNTSNASAHAALVAANVQRAFTQAMSQLSNIQEE